MARSKFAHLIARISLLFLLQPTPTIPSKLLDPGSFPGALFSEVVGGLLFVAAIAVLGWIFGPFKWLWRGKAIRKLIYGRREFILVYNPHSGASKTVMFFDNGQIGVGRNNNEDTWRVRRGCLEFLTDDGKVYRRFRFDKANARLLCTNDPDLHSLFGQYLFPQY
jgi:hypothetical protein